MKKIIAFFKSIFPLLITLCGFLVILVELPLFIIRTLIVLVYGFSVIIFLFRFLHRKEKIYIFPKLVILFCVFTCFIALSSLRTFLTIEKFDEQLSIIRKIGLFICKDNYVCGFFSTVLIVGVVLYFSKLFILNKSEETISSCQNNLNLKIWEIRQKEIDQVITNEKADVLRKTVDSDLDYYMNFEGSLKYFIGTVWAFIGLFIIVTAGGVSVGILEFNLSWHEALNQYIVLSVGYLVVFIIPLFLVSVSFGI